MPVRLKQYGEMRSGTCWTRALLVQNFKDAKVYTNALGWKHGGPSRKLFAWQERNPSVPLQFIICIKNPYAWLWSMLDGIQTGRTPHFKRRNPWGDQKLYRALIGRWNKKYKLWWDLMEKHGGCPIRQEDLLRNLQKALTKIGKKLGLTPRQKPFKNITQVVKPGQHISGKTFSRRTFFLQRKYFKYLPKDLQRLTKKTLDWETAAKYRYTPSTRRKK